MATMIDPINVIEHARVTASVKLTSNGDGAKTAKISILANSGGVCYPDGVPHVFDFKGMSHKSKIPLDWEHNQTIGYCNNFQVEAGQLSCGGVITLVDLPESYDPYGKPLPPVPVNAIAQQMSDGVPYEASIEAWPDDNLSIEFIPEGISENINEQLIAGPVFVFRTWTLKAVALCKFGADYGNTQVALQLSNKKGELKKGYVLQLTNSRGRNMNKDEDKSEVTKEAVEAPAEVEVETETVETEVEAEVKEAPKEESAEVVSPETEVEESEAVEADEPKPVQASAVEAKDPLKLLQETYLAYEAEFGDKAGEYIKAGYSMAEATSKFIAYMKASLSEANKRLASVGGGGSGPLKFGDVAKRDGVKAKANSVIRIAGKKYE